MTILKNPNEIKDSIVLAGLIYGQPGIGKSTVALSAPNPVVIDADNGMRRVEKRFQVPSLPLTDYADVLTLFQSNELDPFDTIIFDTLGKLVDRIGDYLVNQNTKNRKGDGSLSMQGWGALKIEFQNLLKLARSKNKHLIFVAHEKEEKDGDTRIVRPDVSGSSGKDIVKDLDFMGYMEMRGNKRTISFTPTEKFYAKNSLKLPSVIDVPDTLNGNDFIQKTVIEQTIKRQQEDDKQNERYTALIDKLFKAVDAVRDEETANQALELIKTEEIIWDSQRISKKKLSEKTKNIGLSYDKQSSSFVFAKETTND